MLLMIDGSQIMDVELTIWAFRIMHFLPKNSYFGLGKF